MKNWQFVVILLFLVGIMPLVHGAEVVATLVKEQDVVEAGGEITYMIIIKNNQIRDDFFKLEVDDFAVAPFSDVVGRVIFEPSSTISVPSKETREVLARVVFLDSAKVNKNYITNVLIKSMNENKAVAEIGLSAFVISPRDIVEIIVEIPEVIVPGRDEIVKVKFVNSRASAFKDLNVFYTSTTFNVEDKISLGAHEELETEFTLRVDPIVEPGKYILTVRIYNGDNIVGNKNFDFSVSTNPDLKEAEKSKGGFLSSTVEIVRENEGNTRIRKVVGYPTSFFRGLFTKTEPEGELKRNDEGRYYEWAFEIPPGDIYRIKIVTDYKPLFFAIIAILLFVGAFFYFRKRDLKVKKSVFKVTHEHTKEGISEMKILLHVRNITDKEKYNVKIIDFLPRFIKLGKHFGTLPPHKIESGSIGTRLLWNISKIDPGDEIVITYTAESRLSLVGGLVLPAATAQYYGKRKQIVNAKSNRLVFKW